MLLMGFRKCSPLKSAKKHPKPFAASCYRSWACFDTLNSQELMAMEVQQWNLIWKNPMTLKP